MTATVASADRDPRVRWHGYADAGDWAEGIAHAIAEGLRVDLAGRERARLLLSGGRTPAPAYAALSRRVLPWDRVDVGLVDERWLRPDDPDSNTLLVRRALLQDRAGAARFEEMTRIGRSLDDAVHAANLHARRPPGVVTLGMGDDGHTASLFPGMRALDAALADPRAYVAVDASGCAVAAQWTRRISLTPAGLAPAPLRLLLLRGEAKRTVFERALGDGDIRALPIRIALQPGDPPLHVHWCP